MRKFNVLTAIALVSLAAGGAVAKEKPASGEKKICRIVMPAVGRIPAKRECKLKAEWEAADAESQTNAHRAMKSATGRN